MCVVAGRHVEKEDLRLPQLRMPRATVPLSPNISRPKAPRRVRDDRERGQGRRARQGPARGALTGPWQAVMASNATMARGGGTFLEGGPSRLDGS